MEDRPVMRAHWLATVSLCAAVFIAGMLPCAAQEKVGASGSGLADLHRQIEALRREVRELRQARATDSLDEPTSSSQQRFVSEPELDTQLLQRVGYRCDDLHSCFQPQSQSCDACCSCRHCQCPLPEAPCVDCPRASLLSPYFNLQIFGALKLDMLFNARRPVSPGTPFYLATRSDPGFDENTFDIHARQSTLAAALSGPSFGGFQSGGLLMAMFYNDAIVVDQYGFLPLQAYGELRNDDWRFAAGLQFDVFSPGAPTVLPFAVLGASGNAGNAFRGQVRLERFVTPTANRQWTFQVALSEPIVSTIDPSFRLSEDNGWPNVEGRIALGLGCLEGSGADAKRPLELGVSAVGGQIRTTIPATRQVVADVWGVCADWRWKFSDRFGIVGEFYTGQTLGTYNAGILQNVNSVTRKGIRSTGGWLELFTYLTPALHSHIGYGIDDPLDRDVAAAGRIRNDTYFANLLWDINATFRIGGEFTYRETTRRALPDNEGAGFHTQFQWAF